MGSCCWCPRFSLDTNAVSCRNASHVNQPANSLYQSSVHPHTRSIWLKCLDLGSAVRFGRKTFSFFSNLTAAHLWGHPNPRFLSAYSVCLHIQSLPCQLSRSPWRGAARDRESGARAPHLPAGQTVTAVDTRSAPVSSPRPGITLSARRGASQPGGRPAHAESHVPPSAWSRARAGFGTGRVVGRSAHTLPAAGASRATLAQRAATANIRGAGRGGSATQAAERPPLADHSLPRLRVPASRR